LSVLKIKGSRKAAPDYQADATLAGIYQKRGDMVRWKETLEKSLDLPAMGLQHASVQNTIAQYYMERKEWKEAVVYADAAAESYSEWSMATAARCHEMRGEWQEAEAYLRAISRTICRFRHEVDGLVPSHGPRRRRGG
jgi:hypothetical protein